MGRSRSLFVGAALLGLIIVWSAGAFGPPHVPYWMLVAGAGVVGIITGVTWPRRSGSPSGASSSPARVGPTTHVGERRAVTPAGHDLERVEGIGAGYGRRLRELGVADTLELLAKGKNATGREELARLLKVEPLVVQRWTSMADLLRIPGMDGQSAEVLEAANVATVPALAGQRASALVGVLFDVNQRLRLTPTELPSVDQMENWIGMAGLLPGMIEDL